MLRLEKSSTVRIEPAPVMRSSVIYNF